MKPLLVDGSETLRAGDRTRYFGIIEGLDAGELICAVEVAIGKVIEKYQKFLLTFYCFI
jgi:hypothetical protein